MLLAQCKSTKGSLERKYSKLVEKVCAGCVLGVLCVCTECVLWQGFVFPIRDTVLLAFIGQQHKEVTLLEGCRYPPPQICATRSCVLTVCRVLCAESRWEQGGVGV